MNVKELQKKAALLRIEALNAISKADSGCVGSNMSVMDILVAIYYGEILGRPVARYDKKRPGWEDQDYVVLSKGQASAAQYAILADLGFFDKSELDFYRKLNSFLQAYPIRKVPGITVESGASAHGVSVAAGLAMSLKMDRKENKVFAVVGDEELQKGQFWEMALAASHYKLDNLIVFLDNNKLQASGKINVVMDIDPIQDKFEAFGWHVIQVRDGHDYDQILDALVRAVTFARRPILLWCHTVSGKGIPFVEGKPYYHRAVFSEPERIEAISYLKKLL